MSGAGRTVAVLCGGVSAEHEVSLRSGATMIGGLMRAGFTVVPVVIGRDGTWSRLPVGHAAAFPETVARDLPGAAATGGPLAVTQGLIALGVTVAMIGLHGPGGEDGALQGFLQLAGLKYTGPGVAASAIAIDKLLLKHMLRSAGLPTAPWCEFPEEELAAGASARAHARLVAFAGGHGWPVVLKARTLGSSVGVAIVRSEADVAAAWASVAAEGVGVFAEQGVAGVEVSCGVFGSGAAAIAFPAIEIVPAKAAWFDYASKYAAGGALERIPAQISAPEEAEVRRLARAVHQLIGAAGITRTDIIVTPSGPVILETNTLPGMTATSLVPQEARAIGWSLEDLLTRMVDEAAAR